MLTVCNGTVALDLIWKTLITTGKLKKGDKVLCPSFSFVATANSIVNAGLVPVFCDIDKETWNIDPTETIWNLPYEFKAILAVHTFGNPCDIEVLKGRSEETGSLLIEDCAEAFGASYKGKKVGTFGDAAAFSFNATKNLTTGEGGAVTFKDNPDLLASMYLREHGYVGTTRNCEIPGYNYRMSNIACAIGLEQLKTIDERNDIRASNCIYLDSINATFQENVGCADHALQIFGFLCSDKLHRTHVLNHLIENGIDAKTYFSPHIAQQKYYQKYYTVLPISDYVADRIICLPFDEHLSDEEMDYMIDKVEEAI